MRHLITAALALSLIGGAAMAQEHREERGGEEHGGGHPPPAGHPAPPPAARPAPAGHPGGPPPGGGYRAPAPGDRGPYAAGPAPGYRGPAPPAAGFRQGGPGPGARGPRPGGFLAGHGWNGGARFRGPAYYYPQGWGYRYWGFGAFLPAVFLAPNYTIGDYWNYGLPAPPPGYHWIRVGPDALLVRYGDGYVLDAAYGLFY